MIVLGIGHDLVDIRRIAAALARHGDRFRRRVFTEDEIARAETRADPAAVYARRFAAKEAAAKALGTGFARGISWREIAVANDEAGRPRLVLAGRAGARARALAPAGWRVEAHVSLSDEPPYASAFVVLLALPGQTPPAAPGASSS
ncbi:MAG: holo-[acyl-carrier-protein] synthase [Rhodothalassiaceae bacterium]|nr:MAG: holo-[acyl-carrier-protein] synthase [Rhodothalassiaceae bacterium]